MKWLLCVILAVQSPSQNPVSPGNDTNDDLFQFLQSQALQRTSQTGTLEGFVKLEGTEEPVPGVEIHAVGRGGIFALISEGNGHFIRAEVPLGGYSLYFSKDGYFDPSDTRVWVAAGAASATMPLEVVVSTPPQPSIVHLIRGGVLKGIVQKADGRPLEKGRVEVTAVSDINDRRQWNTRWSASVDDRGEYRIFWLPPGKYYVRVKFGSTDIPSDTYYYPGKFNITESKPVSLSSGSEESVDFHLQNTGALVTVTGKFQNSSGKFLRPAFQMQLLRRDGNPLSSPTKGPINFSDLVSVANFAKDSSNGQFEIRNIRPGSYELLITALDDNGQSVVGFTHMEVGSRGLNNVSVLAHSTVNLGVSMNTVQVRYFFPLQLRDYLPSLVSRDSANILVLRARIDDGGMIEFRGIPPGTYDFYSNLGSILDVQQAGKSILPSGLVIGDDAPTPIEVIFGNR